MVLTEIENELTDSVVMVTGGAGYIGTGIVRQLMKYNVKQIIVLDNNVSHFQALETEFSTQDTPWLKLILVNVKNEERMGRIFSEYRPMVVFHVASYQNIVLMESSPSESMDVNITGTKIIADLSAANRVSRFINLSSNVAVNPSSLMDASKQVGEMYLQALAQSKKYPTRFVSIRFGNLAAPGSPVVRLLEKQIAQGGPVTIPHRKVMYHLNSLEETCLLIIEAGFTGYGGEIFQLNLGEPVSHCDLVKSRADKNIEIIIMDSKAEEKLYCNAGYNEDDLIPTLNEKIKIEKTRKYDYQVLNKQLNILSELLNSGDKNELIEQLMYIVPEYISHNSEFGQDNSIF